MQDKGGEAHVGGRNDLLGRSREDFAEDEQLAEDVVRLECVRRAELFLLLFLLFAAGT